jgi:FixJ family two-component response regulator
VSAPFVFIVDDDASARKGMARLLGGSGYRVETFASPLEFLARRPHDGAGCLVLDLSMPEMSGLELQDRLQAAGHTLPIVFVTGHGDVSSSVRAMKGGALDFLQKPFTHDELEAAVRVAVARSLQETATRAELDALREREATLTPRERQVFALVARGLLNKQVAGRLGTTEKTIKAHRARVMEKMAAGSLADLVRMAEKVSPDSGLPDPEPPPATKVQ